MENKGVSDFIGALQAMKRAKEHFESFEKDNPKTRGSYIANGYCKKLDWIIKRWY